MWHVFQTSQTVQRVGTRLVKAAGLGDAYNWEFHVIQADDIMNAMAAPGGKVCVLCITYQLATMRSSFLSYQVINQHEKLPVLTRIRSNDYPLI